MIFGEICDEDSKKNCGEELYGQWMHKTFSADVEYFTEYRRDTRQTGRSQVVEWHVHGRFLLE
jgi:hypothetical protein